MEFSTKTPHLMPADLPNKCSILHKCVGNMETKFSLTELLKERIILIVRGRAKGNPKTARKGSQKVGAKWQRRWPASRLLSSQSLTLRTKRSPRFLARCLSPSASRVLSRLARLVSWMSLSQKRLQSVSRLMVVFRLLRM